MISEILANFHWAVRTISRAKGGLSFTLSNCNGVSRFRSRAFASQAKREAALYQHKWEYGCDQSQETTKPMKEMGDFE
jgi:hypothetical protein